LKDLLFLAFERLITTPLESGKELKVAPDSSLQKRLKPDWNPERN